VLQPFGRAATVPMHLKAHNKPPAPHPPTPSPDRRPPTGVLVRRCTAINDFIVDNRDYLHHAAVAKELQAKSDSDQVPNCLVL
jgi:hypothetical protein